MAQVSVVQVTQDRVEEAVREAIDLLGGMSRFIKQDDLVLLKPNLFVHQPEATGLITSPRVIEAVARLVKKLGAQVVIGERTDNVEQNLAKTEIVNLAEIVKFDDAPRRDIRISGARGLFFDVPMPKIVDDCDVFINVPGLRTHALTLISNALKNLMGMLPRDYTRLVHLCGLNESIVDLNMYRPSDLVVTDAVICAQGNFPGRASPLKLGLIIAGNNAVAVDAVAAHIVGYQPDQIEHLIDASQRGLGPIDLEEIELLGCKIESWVDRFEKAHTSITEFKKQVKIVAPAICASCRQALGCGLKQAEEQGLLDGKEEIVILSGPVEQLPDSDAGASVILYGSCAARWRNHGVFERGCPPLAGQVVTGLREALGER